MAVIKLSLIFHLRLVACLSILLCASSLNGQSLIYDVIRNGNSMGTTEAQRIERPDEVVYHLNTKTSFRIIFSFDVEYDLSETFKNGTLITGTSFNTLNGSVQKETQMDRRESDGYDLVIDGIKTDIKETRIVDSVSEIYHEEPHEGKRLFSAYFGRYLTIEQLGKHRYALTSPDGTNVYTYENGICTQVEVSRDFASFTFKLQPQILKSVRSGKIAGVVVK